MKTEFGYLAQWELHDMQSKGILIISSTFNLTWDAFGTLFIYIFM
jgi:hypothetical protein